jgi:hypothetical protein
MSDAYSQLQQDLHAIHEFGNPRWLKTPQGTGGYIGTSAPEWLGRPQ